MTIKLGLFTRMPDSIEPVTLEQHTCPKCGKAFTEPTLEEGFVRFGAPLCPACRPPAKTRITITDELVPIEQKRMPKP